MLSGGLAVYHGGSVSGIAVWSLSMCNDGLGCFGETSNGGLVGVD